MRFSRLPMAVVLVLLSACGVEASGGVTARPPTTATTPSSVATASTETTAVVSSTTTPAANAVPQTTTTVSPTTVTVGATEPDSTTTSLAVGGIIEGRFVDAVTGRAIGSADAEVCGVGVTGGGELGPLFRNDADGGFEVEVPLGEYGLFLFDCAGRVDRPPAHWAERMYLDGWWTGDICSPGEVCGVVGDLSEGVAESGPWTPVESAPQARVAVGRESVISVDAPMFPLPTCNGQRPTIIGTNLADNLAATEDPDVVVPLGGGDGPLADQGSNDVVCWRPYVMLPRMGQPDRLYAAHDLDIRSGPTSLYPSVASVRRGDPIELTGLSWAGGGRRAAYQVEVGGILGWMDFFELTHRDLGWELYPDGFGPIRFGDGEDELIAELSELFGDGSIYEASEWPTCGDVKFGGHGVVVEVHPVTRTVVGYRYSGIFPTPEGIGVGSTSEEIQAAYPDAVFFQDREIATVGYRAGGYAFMIGGPYADPPETNQVLGVEAGSFCVPL